MVVLRLLLIYKNKKMRTNKPMLKIKEKILIHRHAIVECENNMQNGKAQRIYPIISL